MDDKEYEAWIEKNIKYQSERRKRKKMMLEQKQKDAKEKSQKQN